ncbi:hypothetical protein OQA88_4548 [Cercophora sp. LCS_1]
MSPPFLSRLKATIAESGNMTLVGAVSVAESSRLFDRTSDLVSDVIGLARGRIPLPVPVPALQQKGRALVARTEVVAQRMSNRAEARLRRAGTMKKWASQREQKELRFLRAKDVHMLRSDDDWGDEGWPDRRDDVESLREWCYDDLDLDEGQWEMLDAPWVEEAEKESAAVGLIHELDDAFEGSCIRMPELFRPFPKTNVLPKSGVTLELGGHKKRSKRRDLDLGKPLNSLLGNEDAGYLGDVEGPRQTTHERPRLENSFDDLAAHLKG